MPPNDDTFAYKHIKHTAASLSTSLSPLRTHAQITIYTSAVLHLCVSTHYVPRDVWCNQIILETRKDTEV